MNATVPRRSLFAALLGLAGIKPGWSALTRKRLPEGHEILRSFDARDWARAFVAHVQQKPSIASNEGTMTIWFANALMRGYDENDARYKVEAYVRKAGGDTIRFLQAEAIRGAVARGWCADANRHKEMDCVLAEAITQEILKLASANTEVTGVGGLSRCSDCDKPLEPCGSCPQCGSWPNDDVRSRQLAETPRG